MSISKTISSMMIATTAGLLATSAHAGTCWERDDNGYPYDWTVPSRIYVSDANVTPIDRTQPTGSPDQNGGTNLQASFDVSFDGGAIVRQENAYVSLPDDGDNQAYVTLDQGTGDSGCNGGSHWRLAAGLAPWSAATRIISIDLVDYESTGDSCHSDYVAGPSARYTEVGCGVGR